MSKYKLMDIFESFKDDLSSEEKERYDMLTSDDKDKLERIKALMDKEKVNIEKDAKKSMGMLKEMDLEVSQRIEGLLNMGMKNKFLDMGMDLIQDVLEEDEFDINDIISHLAYELGQHYDSFARQGDRLAGMEEGYDSEENLDEKKGKDTDYSVELLVPTVAYDVESGELADSPYAFATEDEIESGEADVTTYTDGGELDSFVFDNDYEQAVNFAERYPKLIKINSGDSIAEKKGKDTSVKDLLGKIEKHLKGSDRNFQDSEIEMYIDSLKRDIKRGEFDGVESVSMEDHEEDLFNMIADKSLQEHFGRFMKDYQ